MRRAASARAAGTLALVLAASVLGVGAGCGDAPRSGRVLIVGIDGASFRVIDPLAAQGRLPHLAALGEAGVKRPLESLLPMISPRIWNSLATGKEPAEHGIEGFAHRDGAGRERLYLSTDRRARALWTIASAAGLTVGVVNWWNTFPVEAVRGVMIADHLFAREVEGRRELSGAARPPEGPLIHPPEWAARVDALSAGPDGLAGIPNPLRDVAGTPRWLDLGLLAGWYRQDATVARLALAIEEELRPDLMMVLLTGIDRVSHSLWMGMEPLERYPDGPATSPDEQRALRAALERYYEFSDAVIGRLLEGYAQDDLVLVVSDHGFESGSSHAALTGRHESEAALDGVLLARGLGLDPGWQGQVSVLDVAPLVLAWMKLPVARDMAGEVPGFLRRADRAWIDSYDQLERTFAGAQDAGESEALREQLRSLGYLE